MCNCFSFLSVWFTKYVDLNIINIRGLEPRLRKMICSSKSRLLTATDHFFFQSKLLVFFVISFKKITCACVKHKFFSPNNKFDVQDSPLCKSIGILKSQMAEHTGLSLKNNQSFSLKQKRCRSTTL